MGHMGQTCGAVCGALMAIGMAEGITQEADPAQKEACNRLAQAFETKFVELHGDLSCRGLLGLDLGDPEDLQVAQDENLFNTLCPVFVADATRLAGEVLGISV
jgi:C_GCAxxG_C_C family probable redox protein